jgi:SAM-dependent methyltransferase
MPAVKRLAESYWVWRLYHLLVSDAFSLQRPTKHRSVYRYLGGKLGRAADLGCGPGAFIRYLAKNSDEVFAVDIDPTGLGRVRSRNRNIANVHHVVSLVNKLPFADAQLDTVLFLEVLEHLSDDAAAVREIHRVLGDGGKLVLSVPVPPGYTESSEWGHKREGYTAEQIRALLEDNGFRVIEHHFAMFKFSRAATRMLETWKSRVKIPAPIAISWVCYLDYLIGSDARKQGGGIPSCIVVKAEKTGRSK